MKGPDSKKPESSESNRSKFVGTENPRHLRVISALLSRPQLRESIDREAGCSNGPYLISDLRALGLQVPCVRIQFLDRDGKNCRPGVYGLASADRRKLSAWIKNRGGASHG